MQITLRMGAAHDEAVIDGTRFDLSAMTRSERNTATRMIRDTWAKSRGFQKPRRRTRKPRNTISN